MDELSALQSVLKERAGFSTVDASVTEAQVRLVGRVPPNASSQWVLLAHRLLLACESAQWKVDVSKTYFLRQISTGKKMFYAWRLIFQAPNIKAHLTEVVGVIRSTPRPARTELQEFPLTGVGANRNEFQANGKGAGPAGSVPLAAMMGRGRSGG